jgi:hypothetical protein
MAVCAVLSCEWCVVHMCGCRSYIGSTGVDDLGDLFGPYYVHIKSSGSRASTEVWLHGDCLLYTPRLCVVGARLHQTVADAVFAEATQVECLFT